MSSLAQTTNFVETFSISIFPQTVSYFFKMITLISLGRYVEVKNLRRIILVIVQIYTMDNTATFSNLRPVVLTNDDFDDEITHLKEVVPSEFTETVNVSNIAAIKVTQDNVDQLYNNMLIIVFICDLFVSRDDPLMS